MVIYEIAAIDR